MEFRCEMLCNFASHADFERDGFRDKYHLQVATYSLRRYPYEKRKVPDLFFLDKNIHTIATCL